MLVSRPGDSEQSRWSNRFESSFHTASSSRMSSFESSATTQPEWQANYSFLPPGGNIYEHSFVQGEVSGSPFQSLPGKPQDPVGTSSHPSGPTISQQNQQTSFEEAGCRIKQEPTSNDCTPEPSGLRPGLNSMDSNSPAPSVTMKDEKSPTPGQLGDSPALEKEESEELLDDDDLDGDGDQDPATHAQTAAERTAARRKMKRFRLTHQQTRFLMSEFAKQPHPDASHRERLSKEIPGLSPRQVQVWFQNRRAKIKRLDTDDRHQMIRMRAVPDDFDNVQALHSPYGAVHALGTPVTPPGMEYGGASYGDNMMRPLMVDTIRRGEHEDHMSPTAGLSSAFGNVGFAATPTGLANSDLHTPVSPASSERYYNHMSTPTGAGSHTSNPFAASPNMEASSQMQSRQQLRPSQPIQLRDTLQRSRSDSIQSPLRASMSWKGDAINYTTYPASSPGSNGRQQSTYQPDSLRSSPSGGFGYESGSFPGSGGQNSSNINYSSVPSPTRQSPQNGSRARAASATLPLGLDLRHQYRSLSSNHGLSHSSQPSTPRTASVVSYGSPPSYSNGFSSAPLSVPVDYSMPRTPGMKASMPEYAASQLSAPMAPSPEFTQALDSHMSSSHASTPTGDSFGVHSGHGSGYMEDSGPATKRRRSSLGMY